MSNNENLVGNYNLVSNKEDVIASFLKEKNLAYTNAISMDVIPNITFYTKYVKRIIDLLLVTPIFLILVPINIVFAVCTFWDVGRPIFYKQARCGKNGKPFLLVKFRNMNNDTDTDGKLLPPAQRVTKFGKIMRKYSFDELLNFWSVLKGDMSIIGPRPLPMFFYERMSERHKMRCSVRPGLECPRVLMFDEAKYCQYHRQFENDIWYVENISFWTDLKLVFLLFKMTFSFKKRTKNATGESAAYFVGYDEEGCALSLNAAKEKYSI